MNNLQQISSNKNDSSKTDPFEKDSVNYLKNLSPKERDPLVCYLYKHDLLLYKGHNLCGLINDAFNFDEDDYIYLSHHPFADKFEIWVLCGKYRRLMVLTIDSDGSVSSKGSVNEKITVNEKIEYLSKQPYHGLAKDLCKKDIFTYLKKDSFWITFGTRGKL